MGSVAPRAPIRARRSCELPHRSAVRFCHAGARAVQSRARRVAPSARKASPWRGAVPSQRQAVRSRRRSARSRKRKPRSRVRHSRSRPRESRSWRGPLNQLRGNVLKPVIHSSEPADRPIAPNDRSGNAGERAAAPTTPGIMAEVRTLTLVNHSKVLNGRSTTASARPS